ncbi:MAG: helix-turn-helix domain containing protein, partial [Maritimibacter sp.]
MPTTRSRKSASDRKAEIVETAIRLSADVGPNRVTTQHLADAVGVTQPAIFRHFATKT